MSDPDQYTCGGRYWLATAGESVFLSFTGAFVFDKIFHLCSDKVAHVHSLGLLPGTGVTVNFFTLASGRMVQIELNQTYFYRLDTYTAGRTYSTDCRTTSMNFGCFIPRAAYPRDNRTRCRTLLITEGCCECAQFCVRFQSG